MAKNDFNDEMYWMQISEGMLEAIPGIPSDGSGETYNEWLKLCMSMKSAGYSREDVNTWCGSEEFDIARWNDLKPKSTTRDARAHIFNLAKNNGYQLPHAEPTRIRSSIKWYSYDVMNPATINEAITNAQKVMDILYENDSSIFVCNEKNCKGKMVPDSTSIVVTNKKNLSYNTLKEFLQFDGGMYVQLNTIDEKAFSSYKKEKAAGSILNEHIIDWKYAYIEADPVAGEDIATFIAKSKKNLERLDLPWICHLFSGKKSIHTIIRLDASSPEEWKIRLLHIHKYLKKSGYAIDEACKNPNRWERFWCAGRNGSAQYVMAINEATCSFTEWEARHSTPSIKNETFSLLNAKGNISNLSMLRYLEQHGYRAYKDGDSIVTVRVTGKFVEQVEKAYIVNNILQEIAKTQSAEIQEKAVAFLKNQPMTFLPCCL